VTLTDETAGEIVSIPLPGFINLKVRQPEPSHRPNSRSNFGGTVLKVHFSRWKQRAKHYSKR
jgi:hypothetical protein